MKYICGITVILLLTSPLFAKKKESKPQNTNNITTYIDSFSYSVGVFFWEEQILPALKQAGDDTVVNKTLFLEGITHAIKQETKLTSEKAKDIISRYFELKSEKIKMQDSILSASNLKIEQDFLEKNKNEPEIQVTSSGLQYKILSQGTGKKPLLSNKVSVHYEGKLLNGEIFDSSYERGEPIEFPLTNVIEGWQEGLQLLNEGGEIMLYIPSRLGYGNKQVGSIPPSSLLIFKVQLLSILSDEEEEESN